MDKLPKILFLSSLVIGIYSYGLISSSYSLFPYPQILEAINSVKLVYGSFVGNDKILYSESSHDDEGWGAGKVASNHVAEGLILLVGINENRKNMIRVIDRAGNVIHDLSVGWFDIWDKSEGNFPNGWRPKSPPGALLHGIDLLPNGDYVVNFEHLSTMRLNLCGQVIWKLDNQGHHSVHVAEDGTIWVPAENYHAKGPTGFRNHHAPLRSWTLQNISPEGEILKTIPVIDVLRKNDLEGLLYLSTLNNTRTGVKGDTLHLNDIEIFPSHLSSSVFKPGDIMFSLRNINTVIVMDPKSHKIKFRSTGDVLRQHDPDFMDGDVISIFDNRNLRPAPGKHFSRIVEINARTSKKRTVVHGAKDAKFFTDIMGTHQRLPNGNILINSSTEGRLLETLPNGRLVWSYENRLSNGKNGRLTMGMLLPPHMDADFFARQKQQCH